MVKHYAFYHIDAPHQLVCIADFPEEMTPEYYHGVPVEVEAGFNEPLYKTAYNVETGQWEPFDNSNTAIPNAVAPQPTAEV